jgi:hypothetical protein
MASIAPVGRTSRIDRLSRRTRRILAVVTVAGLPAMYAWSAFWGTTSVPSLVWGPVSFVLIGLTVVGSFVLYRYVRDRADMPGYRLDERQRLLRDRAWILSYGVLSAVVVASIGTVAILVLGFGQSVALDGTLVSALALSVGVLLPVLPVAALAWLEPDPLADE